MTSSKFSLGYPFSQTLSPNAHSPLCLVTKCTCGLTCLTGGHFRNSASGSLPHLKAQRCRAASGAAVCTPRPRRGSCLAMELAQRKQSPGVEGEDRRSQHILGAFCNKLPLTSRAFQFQKPKQWLLIPVWIGFSLS